MDDVAVDTTMADMEAMMNNMFANEVKMDVDTLLFPIHQGTFYMTDTTQNPTAGIFSMLVPDTYEETKKAIVENPQNGMKLTIKTKESIRINNKQAIHVSSSTLNEGISQITEIYIIQESEKNTLLITGVILESAYATYVDAVKKAAYSARIESK
ncbi:MAG: hypothetical protein JXQ69_04910 [Paludibacteraceae bacterium]|nr:hypothetical protein [Paludibacteraceae bacterium]